MPWKECHVVEERLRFIARLLDGEKMAGHCQVEARRSESKVFDSRSPRNPTLAELDTKREASTQLQIVRC